MTIPDKMVTLPAQSFELNAEQRVQNNNLDPLTLFIELDDVFLHTFLCDENFGYMANPNAKDPEHEFTIEERRQPVLVYIRDHMDDFLTYLRESKPFIETILYTNSEPIYADRVLSIIDPAREIFDHVLYQNACYVLEKPDEDILALVKTRFDMSILLSLLLSAE